MLVDDKKQSPTSYSNTAFDILFDDIDFGFNIKKVYINQNAKEISLPMIDSLENKKSCIEKGIFNIL
jgi:hypothetical protein